MMAMDPQLVIRLLIAAACGGFVGLERELHGRVAGLRTHILVCVGSCLIMLVSIYTIDHYGQGHGDPSRIAAQVVSGIGFLGAGTILRFKASVRGLTTAASLWTVAGIGLACGVGFFEGALVTTLIILIALFVLSKAERNILRRAWYRDLVIEFTTYDPHQTEQVKAVLSHFPVETRDIDLKSIPSGGSVLILHLKVLSERYREDIRKKMASLSGVVKVDWAEEE